MPTKGKKPASKLSQDEHKSTTRPVVTQVVEVVEMDESPPSVESPEVEIEIQDEIIPETEVVNQAEEEKFESPPLDKKEIVEELFRDRDTASVVPEISEHRRSVSRTIFLWSLTLVVTAVTVGGGLLLFGGKLSLSSFSSWLSPNPTSTPTPTIIPTPTVAPISRNELKVQVLNGAGVPGAAGLMKSLLESKGYEVVGTGNADNYDYSLTQIVVKPGKVAALELLKADLVDYQLDEGVITLDPDREYDVEVIVGAK